MQFKSEDYVGSVRKRTKQPEYVSGLTKMILSLNSFCGQRLNNIISALDYFQSVYLLNCVQQKQLNNSFGGYMES